jgi:ketosteroid isomerase-like protein
VIVEASGRHEESVRAGRRFGSLCSTEGACSPTRTHLALSFGNMLQARPAVSQRVTVDLLKGFLDAFNRHDLDAIMDYFAEDCVFYMPHGVGPRGDRYSGKKDVRAGLAKRFEGIPDVHYGEDRHWTCGDLGVSEWTLSGHAVSGTRLEVRGVDLLEFVDGQITRKDSIWKIVE